MTEYESNINEHQKLKKEKDFLSSVVKQLREDYVALNDKLIDERKRYELKINELEARLKWVQDMNKGLIELSMKVMDLYDGDENEDN